jgi:probable HAF family extracellular repeat protein
MRTTLLAIVLLTCAYAAAGAAVYQIQDLGVLPPVGALYGMNASGQVVGAQGGAFLYTPGSGMNILVPDAAAYAVSESGKVTGVYYPYDGNYRLFVYDPGTGVSYPDLPSSAIGFAISNSGTISGDFRAGDGKRHAFAYTPGVGMTDIGSMLGPVKSYSGAISNLGLVVGHYAAADGTSHQFTYSAGYGVSDIGPLGFSDIQEAAVNSLGQIAGYGWYDRSYAHMHSYLYTPGVGVVDLGVDSQAYGLNDLGQVVGSVILSTTSSAFVYSPGSGIAYLAGLGPGKSRAYHIDNLGRIVGTSYDDSGNLHVVAWNPIPEPSSLLALTAGIGALGTAAKRRKLG